MHRIKIVENSRWGRNALEFTMPPINRNTWTATAEAPASGHLVACMCQNCGLVLFYGVTHSTLQGQRPDPLAPEKESVMPAVNLMADWGNRPRQPALGGATSSAAIPRGRKPKDPR